MPFFEESNDFTQDLGEDASDVKRYPSTGIDVLVVGAGMGGMLCALEGWRKGHNVRVIERSNAPVFTGDALTLQPSAVLVLRHWPKLCKQFEEDQYDAWMEYKRHTGEHIYGPCPPVFNDPENMEGRKGPYVAFMQGRAKTYKSLLRQAARCKIPITFGKRAVDFYEISSGAVEIAGVVLDNGERMEADVVVAADGLKTKSNKLVREKHIQPMESGLAVYRCAFPSKVALENEIVKARWDPAGKDHPTWQFWLGPGIHVNIAVMDDIVCMGLTHKDDGSADESWSPNVDPSELIQCMEKEAPGWHPDVLEMMKMAPKGSIVHWKLMWRDLHERWASPAGRVVQVGDAAHSFLPTSGNGASQAIEDAVTLMACLQLGGKSNAGKATKIYNLLRYQRVSCAQKMAFVNAQVKHTSDWDALKKNPKMIRTRLPKWIWSHDPEAYAYEKYGQAMHHILSGETAEFQNTNFPKGHAFRKWTIDEVKNDIANGISIEQALDGDWN